MADPCAFRLATVLSVTTGILLDDREGIAGVHQFLDYMTGDTLMTHQLVRACDAAAPELKRQHPWLADLTPLAGDWPDLYAWLIEQERLHGDTITVTPLTGWRHRDPLVELADMVGPERVIAVEVSDDA
jgi:hypothetical protein